MESYEEAELLMDGGMTNRWTKAPDGSDIPPPLQRKFLEEWCLVWPRPCSQAEWARAHGVPAGTVRRWKTDPRFRAVWQARAEEEHLSPEFINPVISEMHRIATDPNARPADKIKAGQVLLQMTERLSPPKVRVEVTRDESVEKLSDEEILRLLESTDAR